MKPLAIVPRDPPFAADELLSHPRTTMDDLELENGQQTAAAVRDLGRSPDAYLRLPYDALDTLVGGLVPGDLGYVCAFSGSGKTTLLINLADALARQNKRVYFMGLESRPKALRTKLACLRVGAYDGDVLTGAAKMWSDWPEWRTKLERELERQANEDAIVFDGQVAIGEDAFRAACIQAKHYDADVLIVDHIDHVTLGESRSMWEESVKVNRLALEMAQRHDLRLLIASQCNNEGVRRDVLGQYQPPLAHHVKMGNHKREVAAYMLGLYRPLRPGVSKEELRSVREHNESATGVLEPNAMGIVCMKHRYFGNREGNRCTLRVERGVVSDLNSRRVAERESYP